MKRYYNKYWIYDCGLRVPAYIREPLEKKRVKIDGIHIVRGKKGIKYFIPAKVFYSHVEWEVK